MIKNKSKELSERELIEMDDKLVTQFIQLMIRRAWKQVDLGLPPIRKLLRNCWVVAPLGEFWAPLEDPLGAQ